MYDRAASGVSSGLPGVILRQYDEVCEISSISSVDGLESEVPSCFLWSSGPPESLHSGVGCRNSTEFLDLEGSGAIIVPAAVGRAVSPSGSAPRNWYLF